MEMRGRSSEVERQLPKLNVVGSIPIARSIYPYEIKRLISMFLMLRVLWCLGNRHRVVTAQNLRIPYVWTASRIS